MHGVAKTSGLRRCVRRGLGAIATQRCVAGWAWLFLEMFVCVVELKEGRHDGILQCNAGADVVQAHMWCVVAWGEE